MKFGIEKMSFYVPQYFVDMNDLAKARHEEPEKYTIGIGQSEMAVAPLSQDPVSLAANAALNIVTDEDREKIDFVMFATETGIDQSKAAGIYVHQLLGLKENVRTIELKQACYSATAALQLAKGHVVLNPNSKVLVLAADIARYGLATAGEVTQGAGAVAMLVSAEPKILSLSDESSFITDDIMDFWRPNYSEYAYVDGKYSNDKYIEFFSKVWQAYQEENNGSLDDFEAICFHLPYTKMGIKALRPVLEEGSEATVARLQENYEQSTNYNRRIGNVYTASLYLSFISLLENSPSLEEGAKIGFFSYGSGAVGEFFTGELMPNYKEHLLVDKHQALLKDRERLSVEQYEEIFIQSLPTDGSEKILDTSKDPAAICLQGIKEHMRLYENKTAK